MCRFKSIIINGSKASETRLYYIIPWLKKANFEDAEIEIIDCTLFWINGIWKSGTWEMGVWKTGVWKTGIWMKGVWIDGIWLNGIWINGIDLSKK